VYLCLSIMPWRSMVGEDVKLHTFFSSALDINKCSASHSHHFIPGESSFWIREKCLALACHKVNPSNSAYKYLLVANNTLLQWSLEHCIWHVFNERVHMRNTFSCYLRQSLFYYHRDPFSEKLHRILDAVICDLDQMLEKRGWDRIPIHLYKFYKRNST
jgi:hypothetical protein